MKHNIIFKEKQNFKRTGEKRTSPFTIQYKKHVNLSPKTYSSSYDEKETLSKERLGRKTKKINESSLEYAKRDGEIEDFRSNQTTKGSIQGVTFI